MCTCCNLPLGVGVDLGMNVFKAQPFREQKNTFMIFYTLHFFNSCEEGIYAFRHHSSVVNDQSARLADALQTDLKKYYIPTAIICFGKILVGEVKPSQPQLSPSKTYRIK